METKIKVKLEQGGNSAAGERTSEKSRNKQN